jgi:hypothetical protein
MGKSMRIGIEDRGSVEENMASREDTERAVLPQRNFQNANQQLPFRFHFLVRKRTT